MRSTLPDWQMNGVNPIPEEGKKNRVIEPGMNPDCGQSTFTIKVTYGPNQHEVVVPTDSTFGDLKSVIAQKLGLRPEIHKLLFRGKEKEDDDDLQAVGIKDHSKVLIVEDVTSKQKAPEEVKEAPVISRGGVAVAQVREEVDMLAEQASALKVVVDGGTMIDEKDIVYLTEMLMRQLLKLDGIDAEGEGRVQRKMEVRRIQTYVETMDTIKLKNSNLATNANNNVSVTTQWETFEPVDGSAAAAASQMLSSSPTPVPSSMPPSKPSPASVELESPHYTLSSTPDPIQETSSTPTPTPTQGSAPPMPSSTPAGAPTPTQFSTPMQSSTTKVTQDWEQFD